MVKLSEFVGEIIKDLASARTYADYSAAAASEMYHSDPFIKNLPIPHYIIDEVEIDVPVMVVGVAVQSADYSNQKHFFNEILQNELANILLATFKWNYINERIKRQNTSENEAEKNIDYKNTEFNVTILRAFNECIKIIVDTVAQKFAANLELYNYEVLKLLELTESFSKELKYAIKKEIIIFTTEFQKDDFNPFLTKESISNAITYVSNIMFFHFKKVMQSNSSVQVEVNTSKMNEYAQKDCMMHIKLKIKEQDLNLIVENQNDKEKRFLSLT